MLIVYNVIIFIFNERETDINGYIFTKLHLNWSIYCVIRMPVCAPWL